MADKAGSLAKVKILPRRGPGRAGFAVKRADNRIWSDIDGTLRPVNTTGTKNITAAAATLSPVDSGAKVNLDSTTTIVVTLPPPAAGLEFEFFVKTAATSGSGHTINPTAGASLFAKGFTAANGKGAQNTQATGAQGDGFYLWSDGTNWFGFVDAGTWARTP